MSETIEFRILRSTHYRNNNLSVWRVERKSNGMLLGEFNDRGDLRMVDRLGREDEEYLSEKIREIMKTLI